MESAPVRLIVTHGPNLGHEYILRGDEATIGRSASNTISLPSPEISRRHSRIWMEGNLAYLEDLGSTNGTYINNTRLYDAAMLYDGDEIQIGDSFRLLFASPEGVTRPISMVPEAAADKPQPAPASSDLSDSPDSYPAPEIPTTKPPLSTSPGEEEFAVEHPAAAGRPRRTILWCGCSTLLLLSICLLALFFLDSYQQGRLLYCGNLNPFFNFFLGPFGFSPICP